MGTRVKKLRNHSTSSFQIILAGFLGIILLGALLLALPLSAADRSATPFADCLFTSVSATCVTGLVVRDTATHWSMFGQLVILLLIQIGGMGVITVAVAFFRMSGKRITLGQRSLMQKSISAPEVGGIVRRTGFLVRCALAMELAGAIALWPVFWGEFGPLRGLWYAVFHSVSAFCNAGFDLMGVKGPFSSLTYFQTNAWLNAVVMLLIIVGGIGFLVWEDIRTNRFRVKRYRLQTKLVLGTSAVLILVPAVLNFFLEYQDLPFSERLLSSLFQSVTTRTAGFNTADLAKTSEAGQLQMIALMLVGGSPGSTAGGMKTTTLAVLFLAGITVFRRKNDAEAFRRRIGNDVIRNAGTILFIYLALFLVGAAVISRLEGLPLLTCMFETGSAVGTVGLTLVYALLPGSGNGSGRLPMENVTVG